MEKRYLSPEDAAPFLGLSAAAVRKYMRNGSMDLGMVLSPQKTGTKTWRYKIYPEKLKQITGSSVPGYEYRSGKERKTMAKIKNYDGQTGMELSYVAVQATRPKKKTVDWVGITETFIAGGMWVIVFMMLGATLAVQVL